MNFENDSVYGFMDDDYSAPVAEQAEPLVREVNWQSSNNERFKRAPDTNEPEQKDESNMAYWRMFTHQMPKGSFEQSVSIKFGGREAIGERFREKKFYM